MQISTTQWQVQKFKPSKRASYNSKCCSMMKFSKNIPSKFIWVGISFYGFFKQQGWLGISATTISIDFKQFFFHPWQHCCVHSQAMSLNIVFMRLAHFTQQRERELKETCNLSKDESMHFFSSTKVISQNERKTSRWANQSSNYIYNIFFVQKVMFRWALRI